MSNFEDIIKNKVEKFEYANYAPDWENFEKKLIKYNLLKKIFFYTIAIFVAIMVSVFYFNTNTPDTTFKPQKNIVVKIQPKQIIKENLDIPENTDINNLKEQSKISELSKNSKRKPNNDIRKSYFENNNQLEQTRTIKNDNKQVLSTQNIIQEKELIPDFNAEFYVKSEINCVPFDINFNINKIKGILYTIEINNKKINIDKKFTIKSKGDYFIKLTASYKNIVKTKDTIIKAYETPTVDFVFNTFDNNTFKFSSDKIEKQIWKFGDNISSNEINPEHKYTKIGKTIVSLTIENQFGCSSTKTKTIFVEPVYKIPNAFSPNNDGDNDEFGPVFKNVDNYKYYLYIYDVYGNFIFKSLTKNINWNGKIKNTNQIVSKGIYIWEMIIKDYFGNKIIKKGTVTIK